MNEVAVQQERRLGLISELETTGNLTVLGFTLPENVTWDQFEAIGRMFGSAHEALKFAVGDWLLMGQKVFGDDVYQAVEATGISKASMMQYVRVAERIPMERRNPLLTWSHHRAVVALEADEQDVWLNRAASSNWSKTELEEHLREQREEPKTTVRQHERKLPGGYVVEAVCDAAEDVWTEREEIDTAEAYRVPASAMLALGRALGQSEGETEA